MPQAGIAIIGAGSWGTALAVLLAELGQPVRLWVRRPELAEKIHQTRLNDLYLPGIRLPESIRVAADPAAIFEGIDTLICAVPSHAVRAVFRDLRPHVPPGACIISATKGIENETCMLMTEVLGAVLGPDKNLRLAALTGPTFALEVVRGDPAAAVIAAADSETATRLQKRCSGRNLRLYSSCDLVGVQIGGAVKNIIAIASGIVSGLGLGYNTAAALITRGLAELKRLCTAAGGRPESLSGLAGLGDLVLTCTGALSRNRTLGVELGRGRQLEEVLAGMHSVAEGVRTTQSAVALAHRLAIEMPITDQMFKVLYEGKPPLEAIRDLMERELKSEF